MAASVQWLVVAYFLYFEIGLTILLVLPLLKSSTWKWIFSWRVFATVQPVWNTLFYAMLVVLVVLFVDAIRTMVKYGTDIPDMQLNTKIERHFQECRGQRNYYITGFALFLILVIRRLITMHSSRATLEASHEAALRQAQQASQQLRRNIEEQQEKKKPKVKKEGKEGGETGVEDVPKAAEGPSQEEYEELQKELRMARTDLEAIRKQAESTNQEYDRLTDEYQKLQNRVQALERGDEEGEEGKKDQ